MLDGRIQIESLLPQSIAWLLLGFGGNLQPFVLCQYSLHHIETRQIQYYYLNLNTNGCYSRTLFYLTQIFASSTLCSVGDCLWGVPSGVCTALFIWDVSTDSARQFQLPPVNIGASDDRRNRLGWYTLSMLYTFYEKRRAKTATTIGNNRLLKNIENL